MQNKKYSTVTVPVSYKTVLVIYAAGCHCCANDGSVEFHHGNAGSGFASGRATGHGGQTLRSGGVAHLGTDRARHVAARRADSVGAGTERAGGGEHRDGDAGVSRAGEPRAHRGASAVRLLRARQALVPSAGTGPFGADAERHARKRERVGDGGAQGDPRAGAGGIWGGHAEHATVAGAAVQSHDGLGGAAPPAAVQHMRHPAGQSESADPNRPAGDGIGLHALAG